MYTNYQARWVSRKHLVQLRKSGSLGNARYLDHLKGTLIVEPIGSEIGDGPVLSREEADYELQPSWLLGPQTKIREARRRLGLEPVEMAAAGS